MKRKPRRPAAPVADAFDRSCPSRGILDRVTSRWGVLVLVGLRGGTLRFSELRRRIDGVSEKMLSQTLRQLEQDGFVERYAHAVIPPRVDYSLTRMGAALIPHLVGLLDFIYGHLPDVLAARKG